jgi:hypothetical protein
MLELGRFTNMENNNSRSEFYFTLFITSHSDVTSSAQVPRVERLRDANKMEKRFRSEGLSFLTKTLPRLGKAIDQALSTGEQLQTPFLKLRKGSQIPVLLGNLISRVFDSDGLERSDACPVVLGYLRQLLFMFYKLELPYNERTVANAVQSFVEVDNECTVDIGALDDDSLIVLQQARKLVRLITYDLDLVNIHPKHGPGVVSTGETMWEKTHFSRINAKLEKKYPFTEYFFFNYTHLSDRLDVIQDLPEVDSGSAKLVAVPKDSRGPRLISCEPLENQWIQQGQMTKIVDLIEAHPLTKGRVNFTDQTVNGALALEGSKTREWCTLDMKEASDRVSVDLVKYLFHEHIYEYFDASRSTHTELPDGTLHYLKKFAPMGSALCFPVEALVFWSLAVSSIIHTRKMSLEMAASLVYVYGDDIICRSGDHATIRQYLPKFGLLFNEAKCCTAGSFRESCGVDAFKGVDVTPTKFSSVWHHPSSPETLASYVAYSNALYAKGYYATAQIIETEILKRVRVPYSQTAQFGGIAFVRPGEHTANKNRSLSLKRRYNKHLQREEIRSPFVETSVRRGSSTDWEELLYRWGEQAPQGCLFVPKRHESSTSLADQILAMNARTYDAEVARSTIYRALNPKSCFQSGRYTVRHRNRLQWRWHGCCN